jgi:galactokinase
MSDFAALFQREPTAEASAPGRVNLMGEHTDYNGGFVLPTPIRQRTRVRLAPRADGAVQAASALSGGGPAGFRLGGERPGRGWLDYVQGVTALLRENGHRVAGFDLLVESDVPPGSGLSSSAALLVALFRALRAAFGLALDDRQVALLSQRVENRFVGAQVGIMDPTACSLGQPGAALLLDTRSLAAESVPLSPGLDWVVINSGVAHQHAGGDYNARRAECERACGLLGVAQLRDLTADDLPRLAALPAPLGRRARHVVTENARVLEAAAALRRNDPAALGRLFNASHDSQRDDYEVSVPAVDRLVAEARRRPEVYGVRLTGGGFGGAVVLFTSAGRGAAAGEAVARAYASATGNRPTVLALAPPGGGLIAEGAQGAEGR